MAARRQVTVEEIILMQSMFAANKMRGQRDRLLEFQVQLKQRQQTPGENPIEEVVSGLAEVCFKGLKAAARYLTVCLDKASENGARLAPDPSFSDWHQLLGAVAASQRLPARPTTRAEAFSRIQAALYAVKLLQEHVLPRCFDDLPTATVQVTEEIRSLLDRACDVVNLAINHIDLAVAATSRFVQPKEVAVSSRFADRYTSFGWDMEDLKIKRLVRGLNEADLLEAIKPRSSTFDF